MTDPAAPGPVPAGATPEGDGVIIGSGPVRVDAYGAAFAACVAEAPYLGWPTYVTERADALGVSATPTVLVAGVPVRPEAPAITAAVAGAGR